MRLYKGVLNLTFFWTRISQIPGARSDAYSGWHTGGRGWWSGGYRRGHGAPAPRPSHPAPPPGAHVLTSIPSVDFITLEIIYRKWCSVWQKLDCFKKTLLLEIRNVMTLAVLKVALRGKIRLATWWLAYLNFVKQYHCPDECVKKTVISKCNYVNCWCYAYLNPSFRAIPLV